MCPLSWSRTSSTASVAWDGTRPTKLSQRTVSLRGPPHVSISSAREKGVLGQAGKGRYHVFGQAGKGHHHIYRGHWKGGRQAPFSTSRLQGDPSYLIKLHTTTNHSGRQEECIHEGSGGDQKDTKNQDGSIL